MTTGQIRIPVVLDTAPAQAAISGLVQVLGRFPQLVHLFRDIDPNRLFELRQVHGLHRSTDGALEVRIALEPSDRLVKFLAAPDAGDFERQVVGIDIDHGSLHA